MAPASTADVRGGLALRVKAHFTDGITIEWLGITYVLDDLHIGGARFFVQAEDERRYLWLNPAVMNSRLKPASLSLPLRHDDPGARR